MLRLMVLDPLLFREAGSLGTEDFSSPLLGKAYTLLKERYESGRSTQLAALTGQLTPQEMNHLAGVIDQPEDRANSRRALQDYIAIIETERVKRQNTAQAADPLLAARERYREKKAYGGAKV